MTLANSCKLLTAYLPVDSPVSQNATLLFFSVRRKEQPAQISLFQS